MYNTTLEAYSTGPVSIISNEVRSLVTTRSKELTMERKFQRSNLARITMALTIAIAAGPNVHARQVLITATPQESAQHQEQLQQVIENKGSYASNIVSRWEDAAKSSGRWDNNYASDLYIALMKLSPENLLVAGEAPSFQAMMTVLATGHSPRSVVTQLPGALSVSPAALGDAGNDMVYTPVTPCRIVDTRNAGGIIAANSTRSFDMDGSSFGTQGGYNGSCGIPYGVAYAVAMTIASTGSTGVGYFTAWSVSTSQPYSSTLNYAHGQTIANTTIVPTEPGSGADFNLYSGESASHAVIDVVGYFAAPVATALDCTNVSPGYTAIPVNSWTYISAGCPAGYTATGGGWTTSEGTLGYPGVWVISYPSGNSWGIQVDNQTNGSRNIAPYAVCCRVPGR